ncbi:MAG: Bax inhibitor-1/YccA family protein [Acidimicrobiia bacterium]
MANPILNDKAFGSAATKSGATWAPPKPGVDWNPPISDGPITSWQSASDRMTVSGTATAAGVLFVLLLISAGFGWAAVPAAVEGQAPTFPGIAMVGVIVGFVAVIVSMFKPKLARFLAPVYAIAQGYFVGAISKAYENYQDGIVVQAAGATIAVFAVMLFLYGTRIIKVTDRMRRIVIGATMGIALLYLVSFVIRLLGGNVSFLQQPSLLGIGFSVLVVGLAAFNLALDFDFIERGTKANLPKHMEWVAALGLLVTVVWLYLEILRLLSKLRDR